MHCISFHCMHLCVCVCPCVWVYIQVHILRILHPYSALTKMTYSIYKRILYCIHILRNTYIKYIYIFCVVLMYCTGACCNVFTCILECLYPHDTTILERPHRQELAWSRYMEDIPFHRQELP